MLVSVARLSIVGMSLLLVARLMDAQGAPQAKKQSDQVVLEIQKTLGKVTMTEH